MNTQILAIYCSINRNFEFSNHFLNSYDIINTMFIDNSIAVFYKYYSMCVIFDYNSSIMFWRLVYPLGRTPHFAMDEAPELLAFNKAEVVNAASQLPYACDLKHEGKYHVLAYSSQRARSSNEHHVHVWSSPIAYGGLFEIKPGVLIESPEFVFLRASTALSFAQLVALGDELCGFYSFSRNEERGFRKREAPLTCKAKIAAFLASMENARGCKRAKLALAHVVDGSASPMETFDELLLCFPVHRGGYGLPQPLMNKEVPLTPKAARIAKRESCRLDLSWENTMLDVEHHGKLDHSSEADRASDRARVNALEEMGYEVIELTYDQVDDLRAFEIITARIARIVGKRLRTHDLGPLKSRIQLRKELGFWNRSYGMLP